MPEKDSSQEAVNLELMAHKIEEVKELAKENRTALLGSSGQPGLVINFATLCTRVANIEQDVDKLMNNDLVHIEAKIDELLKAQKPSKDDGDSVKWSEIMKEWVKPVVVSILTAILVYFIVTSGIAK